MNRTEDSFEILDTLRGIREVGEDYADRIDEIHGMYDKHRASLERLPGKLLATTGRLAGPVFSLHQLRFRDTILMVSHEGPEIRANRESHISAGRYFPPAMFFNPNGAGADHGTDSPWWGWNWQAIYGISHVGAGGPFQSDWPSPDNPDAEFEYEDEEGVVRTIDIPAEIEGQESTQSQQMQVRDLPQDAPAGSYTTIETSFVSLEVSPTLVEFSEESGVSSATLILRGTASIISTHSRMWVRVIGGNGWAEVDISAWRRGDIFDLFWDEGISIGLSMDTNYAPVGFSQAIIVFQALADAEGENILRDGEGKELTTAVVVSSQTKLTLSLRQGVVPVIGVRRNISFQLDIRAVWVSQYDSGVDISLDNGTHALAPTSVHATNFNWNTCMITGGTGRVYMNLLAQDDNHPTMQGTLNFYVDDPLPFVLTIPSSIWRGNAFDMTIDAQDPIYTPHHGTLPITDDAPNDILTPDYIDNAGWSGGVKTTSITPSGSGADSLPVEITVVDYTGARRGTANTILYNDGSWPQYIVYGAMPAFFEVWSLVASPYTLYKPTPALHYGWIPVERCASAGGCTGSYEIQLDYVAHGGGLAWQCWARTSPHIPPPEDSYYYTPPWPFGTDPWPNPTVGKASPIDRTFYCAGGTLGDSLTLSFG